MALPGVSTVIYDGYPFGVAFEGIAAAGFKTVEPAFIKGYVDFDETAFEAHAAVEMRGALVANGLKATAVSAHLDLGAAGADECLARRIGFAELIGASILITNSTRREEADEARRRIETALTCAQKAGVILALENPGHGSDDMVGTGTDCAALLAEFDSPALRINFDFCNIHTYSRGTRAPVEEFARAATGICHAHLKDIRDSGGSWAFTALGDGDLDYQAIAAAIARHTPDLPLSMELPMRLTRPGYTDPSRGSERLRTEDIEAALARSLNFWSRAVNVAAETHQQQGTRNQAPSG